MSTQVLGEGPLHDLQMTDFSLYTDMVEDRERESKLSPVLFMGAPSS